MGLSWEFIHDSTVGLLDVLRCAPLDSRDFPTWIADTIAARGLRRNEIVHASHLNQTFAYQIIAGTRHAARDKLIQLAFGMGLDIDEASELLERGGSNALSSRCRRDVVIAYALDRCLSVLECDDLLWSVGERTLVTRGAARRI
jgi:hypothetical protein